MKSVSVIPNLTRANAKSVTDALLEQLRRLALAYYLPLSQRAAFPLEDARCFLPEEELFSAGEVILPVGGDGSVIRAAKRAALHGKRVLGVNAGRLAYLCGLDVAELPLLEALQTGDYTVQRRIMLQARTYLGNELLREDLCINDVSFCRGRSIGLVDLQVSADDKPIANLLADGVIFATPTGSTGYSLSAGGPVLEPTLDAVLLTAVCPHTLAARPYIFHADTRFTVRTVRGQRTSDVCCSCDGEETFDFPDGAWAEITRAGTAAELISITNDHFIDVLNRKIKNWYGSENT
ncbi:MAG: NAD(+)/NADH kinase [Clostridia bacterium]|nr:NAD(+)/NADH kinase [Clostridia bacterium]